MPDPELGPSMSTLPRRTSLLYAIAAAAWILFSDLALAGFQDIDTTELALNLAKGMVFVAATAAVLYVVLRRWAARTTEALHAASRAQARFEVLVEGTDDLIVVLGENGVVTYASPSMQRVLGWSVEEAIGARGRAFVHPDDVDDAVAYLASIRSGSASDELRAFRLLTPEGRWRWVELMATDLRHEPSVAGVVVHGRDVTDRRLATTRLEHALHHDPITGLANRARFEADLRDADLGARARGLELLVLVVDLFAFRDVNATVGLHGGDQVLRHVADRISSAVDAVATGRLGADEFGVAVRLPPDGSAEQQATSLAHHLAVALDEPVQVDGHRLHVTASIGGAMLPRSGLVDRGLLAAEANMQAAKDHPDRVVVTVLADRTPPRTAAQLAGTLHLALERGELELFYQPQYDLRTGAVVAAEALLRWRHPTDGLLLPRSFLTEATRGSLLPLVTRFVLASATAQAATWRDDGHPVSVSVNLTLGDLRRQSLIDEVLGALDANDLDPAMLRLELTEHTLLSEPDRSLQTMRRLRSEGVTFSIDDFGTGYSSLLHVRTLPVAELKIDKTFVGALEEGSIDDVIVSAVLDLGRRTELVTVAEGIETPEILGLLAERGCDRGQGYLLCRPVPAADVPFAPFTVAAGHEP